MAVPKSHIMTLAVDESCDRVASCPLLQQAGQPYDTGNTSKPPQLPYRPQPFRPKPLNLPPSQRRLYTSFRVELSAMPVTTASSHASRGLSPFMSTMPTRRNRTVTKVGEDSCDQFKSCPELPPRQPDDADTTMTQQRHQHPPQLSYRPQPFRPKPVTLPPSLKSLFTAFRVELSGMPTATVSSHTNLPASSIGRDANVERKLNLQARYPARHRGFYAAR